jgi:molybdopterin converting factor small subunit
MRIHVRLFASLRDLLPREARGITELELPEGSSVADVVRELAIEERLAQMVLVNGVQVSRRRDERARLKIREGDTLSIFPPVAGG